MNWRLLVVASLLVAAPVRADSIDEAEARRRGVPLAEVLAEHQLEIENRKIAQLEKQVADLQAQLASLQPAADAIPAESPNAAATPAAPAESPLDFSGPRASSPLYDDFVKRYLSGDWVTLAADMAAKKKQIDALPAGNAADLAYIERTLAECRPAWWDQVKQGKVKQIKPVIWKQSFTVAISDAPEIHPGEVKGASAMTFSLGLPLKYLDSRDPLPASDIGGGDIPPNLTFTLGDGISAGFWGALGGYQGMARLGLDKSIAAGKPIPDLTKHYLAFWVAAMGAYFATPNGRRVACFGDCVALNPAYTGFDEVGERNVGSLVVEEIVGHQDRYPQFHIPHMDLKADAFPPQVGNGESFIAGGMLEKALLQTPFTLAEDRALRDAIKDFANANLDSKVEKLTLPNGQFIALDPAKDRQAANERYAWLKDKMKGH